MPWVPRVVLDELLEAQRLLRERVAAPRDVRGDGPEAPAPLRSADLVTQPAARGNPLPTVVAQAVEQYSFADPAERAANYALAQSMHDAGKPAGEIIAALRSGGRVPEFVL